MDDPDLRSLSRCLDSLKCLFIDIDRIAPEKAYEEKRGGYGDVQVSTLDAGTPSAKLVAAKTIRLYHVKKRPHTVTLRFARELRVWAALRHPHVLSLLGFYLDKDRRKAILLSDYMINGDLKEYIEERNPSWNVRLALARDIADGLVYLHTHTPPICHGDLKMGNILVSPQLRALLTDFGLSKILEEEAPTGLTTSNGLNGTVRYYSPELILEPDAKKSLRSDIWAWGCLIFEMLTNTIAFAEKRTEAAIYLASAKGETPAGVESLPIPYLELKALLSKCWNLEPTERPSASECLLFMSQLEDIPTHSNHTTHRAMQSDEPAAENSEILQEVEDQSTTPEGVLTSDNLLVSLGHDLDFWQGSLTFVTSLTTDDCRELSVSVLAKQIGHTNVHPLEFEVWPNQLRFGDLDIHPFGHEELATLLRDSIPVCKIEPTEVPASERVRNEAAFARLYQVLTVNNNTGALIGFNIPGREPWYETGLFLFPSPWYESHRPIL